MASLSFPLAKMALRLASARAAAEDILCRYVVEGVDVVVVEIACAVAELNSDTTSATQTPTRIYRSRTRCVRTAFACSLSSAPTVHAALLPATSLPTVTGQMSHKQDKATTERHAKMLREMLKSPENKVCADCKRNGVWYSSCAVSSS